MLLDVEIPIAELTRGDRVVVELDGGNILGVVVGTNVKYGTIGFLPSICRTADSDILTIEPGKHGVKVFKQVDSEAAVTEPLTWETIEEFEPDVLVLLNEIKTERPHEHNYLSIWQKYKERLSNLVGWWRDKTAHPQLRSSAAYNIVYRKLLDNLRDPE